MERTILPERCIGSMGSRFTRFRFPPGEIPVLAKLDWNAIARRVFIDPVSGVIDLMSPSSKHEQYAWGAGDTVKAMSDRLGLQVITLGATRWRGPDDPADTGAEPDVCFYLGQTAERWLEARRQGEETLEAFERRTPPELVIEVERSRGDGGNPDAPLLSHREASDRATVRTVLRCLRRYFSIQTSV